MAKPIAVARDEARTCGVDFEERAEAIVCQLKEPAVVIEGGGACGLFAWPSQRRFGVTEARRFKSRSEFLRVAWVDPNA